MGTTETYWWATHYHVLINILNNKPNPNVDINIVNYFNDFIIKNNIPFTYINK